MSWSELERLVDQAEAQPSLRRSLKECCSAPELILAATRLGYRITRLNLLCPVSIRLMAGVNQVDR
jgi:hypothetical protein